MYSTQATVNKPDILNSTNRSIFTKVPFRLLSGLFLPAMPFSWQLWLGVFVSLIVGAMSLIAIEYVYKRKETGATESDVNVNG